MPNGHNSSMEMTLVRHLALMGRAARRLCAMSHVLPRCLLLQRYVCSICSYSYWQNNRFKSFIVLLMSHTTHSDSNVVLYRDLALPSSLRSYSSLSLALPPPSLSRARVRTSSWPAVPCLYGCVDIHQHQYFWLSFCFVCSVVV